MPSQKARGRRRRRSACATAVKHGQRHVHPCMQHVRDGPSQPPLRTPRAITEVSMQIGRVAVCVRAPPRSDMFSLASAHFFSLTHTQIIFSESSGPCSVFLLSLFFPPPFIHFTHCQLTFLPSGVMSSSSSSTLRPRTAFRPCIDLHSGQVKQIVGGSLNDNDASQLKTNFVSTYVRATLLVTLMLRPSLFSLFFSHVFLR